MTEATQITYNATSREVTIVFRDGVRVTLPLQEALRLGDQLVRLIRPINVEMA